MNEDEITLTAFYAPCAIYYQESDSLEYVRADIPSIYRRIDDILTLIFSLKGRELIGFRLKGFRHFYFHHLKKRMEASDESFLMMVDILQEAVGLVGDTLFSHEEERLAAYHNAANLAESDKVKVNAFSG